MDAIILADSDDVAVVDFIFLAIHRAIFVSVLPVVPLAMFLKQETLRRFR